MNYVLYKQINTVHVEKEIKLNQIEKIFGIYNINIRHNTNTS